MLSVACCLHVVCTNRSDELPAVDQLAPLPVSILYIFCSGTSNEKCT
jgi:hypothetical protein